MKQNRFGQAVPTILLIEDDPEDVLLLKKRIAQDSEVWCKLVHVETMSAAEVALGSQEHDVVLLDLSLPDSFGLASIDRVHAAREDIPVVVLTGAHDEQLAQGAIHAGAQDYLLKHDLSSSLLRRTVYHSIERHRLVQKLEEREREVIELAAELEQKNRHLEELSTHDALTGLYNRRFFDAQIVIEVARAQREDSAVFLLLCDVDKFKEVNDTLGHAAGDGALVSVATSLSEVFRASDFSARYGGDEFAVIGQIDPALQNEAEIRIRSTLIGGVGSEPRVTLSLGMAVSSGNVTPDELFHQADMALYQSKEAGRNRLSVVRVPD